MIIMGNERLEQNAVQGAGQPDGQSEPNQQINVQNQQNSGNLPEGFMQPNDVPPELKANYDHMVKAYTQARMSDTEANRDLEAQVQQLQQQATLSQQKAEQLDTLVKNPSFIQWANNQYDKPQGNNIDDGVFDEFEGGEAIQKLANVLTENINKRLAPIEQALASNRQDAEFQTLVNIAKEKGWPDPGQYRDTIDFNMRQYNMSAPDAYQKALGQAQISGLVTRKPINQPLTPVQPGQNLIQTPPTLPQSQQNSGIPITGSGGNVVSPPGNTRITTNPLSSKTALEQALEERSSGKTTNGVPVEDIIKKITDDMNIKGANIDIQRDL